MTNYGMSLILLSLLLIAIAADAQEPRCHVDVNRFEGRATSVGQWAGLTYDITYDLGLCTSDSPDGVVTLTINGETRTAEGRAGEVVVDNTALFKFRMSAETRGDQFFSSELCWAEGQCTELCKAARIGHVDTCKVEKTVMPVIIATLWLIPAAACGTFLLVHYVRKRSEDRGRALDRAYAATWTIEADEVANAQGKGNNNNNNAAYKVLQDSTKRPPEPSEGGDQSVAVDVDSEAGDTYGTSNFVSAAKGEEPVVVNMDPAYTTHIAPLQQQQFEQPPTLVKDVPAQSAPLTTYIDPQDNNNNGENANNIKNTYDFNPFATPAATENLNSPSNNDAMPTTDASKSQEEHQTFRRLIMEDGVSEADGRSPVLTGPNENGSSAMDSTPWLGANAFRHEADEGDAQSADEPAHLGGDNDGQVLSAGPGFILSVMESDEDTSAQDEDEDNGDHRNTSGIQHVDGSSPHELQHQHDSAHDASDAKNQDDSDLHDASEVQNQDASDAHDVFEAQNQDGSDAHDASDAHNQDDRDLHDASDAHNKDDSDLHDASDAHNKDDSDLHDASDAHNKDDSDLHDASDAKNHYDSDLHDASEVQNQDGSDAHDASDAHNKDDSDLHDASDAKNHYDSDLHDASEVQNQDGSDAHDVSEAQNQDGSDAHDASDAHNQDDRDLHDASDAHNKDDSDLHDASDAKNQDDSDLHDAAGAQNQDDSDAHDASDAHNQDDSDLHDASDANNQDDSDLHDASEVQNQDDSDAHDASDTHNQDDSDLHDASDAHIKDDSDLHDASEVQNQDDSDLHDASDAHIKDDSDLHDASEVQNQDDSDAHDASDAHNQDDSDLHDASDAHHNKDDSDLHDASDAKNQDDSDLHDASDAHIKDDSDLHDASDAKNQDDSDLHDASDAHIKDDSDLHDASEVQNQDDSDAHDASDAHNQDDSDLHDASDTHNKDDSDLHDASDAKNQDDSDLHDAAGAQNQDDSDAHDVSENQNQEEEGHQQDDDTIRGDSLANSPDALASLLSGIGDEEVARREDIEKDQQNEGDVLLCEGNELHDREKLHAQEETEQEQAASAAQEALVAQLAENIDDAVDQEAVARSDVELSEIEALVPLCLVADEDKGRTRLVEDEGSSREDICAKELEQQDAAAEQEAVQAKIDALMGEEEEDRELLATEEKAHHGVIEVLERASNRKHRAKGPSDLSLSTLEVSNNDASNNNNGEGQEEEDDEEEVEAFARMDVLDATANYNTEYKGRMLAAQRPASEATPFIGFSLAEDVAKEALIVDGLYKDGPAFQTGVRIGDTLLRVGNAPVQTISDARDAVSAFCKVTHVTPITLRSGTDGKEYTVSLWIMTADARHVGQPYFFDVREHERMESTRQKNLVEGLEPSLSPPASAASTPSKGAKRVETPSAAFKSMAPKSAKQSNDGGSERRSRSRTPSYNNESGSRSSNSSPQPKTPRRWPPWYY